MTLCTHTIPTSQKHHTATTHYAKWLQHPKSDALSCSVRDQLVGISPFSTSPSHSRVAAEFCPRLCHFHFHFHFFFCARANTVIPSLCILGKSSLTIQFAEGRFVDSYYPTIENTVNKTIKYKGQEFAAEIMDTAGQVVFLSTFQIHIFAKGEKKGCTHHMTLNSYHTPLLMAHMHTTNRTNIQFWIRVTPLVSMATYLFTLSRHARALRWFVSSVKKYSTTPAPKMYPLSLWGTRQIWTGRGEFFTGWEGSLRVTVDWIYWGGSQEHIV